MIYTSIIPSHSIAVWLLSHIDKLLNAIGLEKYHTIEQIIYFAIIVSVSLGIGWLLQRATLWISEKVAKARKSDLTRDLLAQHTLTKCSYIIPPLVFLSLAPFAFDSTSEALTIIIRCALVLVCLTFAFGLTAIVTFLFTRYNKRANTKNLPIKGILAVINGLIWMLAIIVAVSIVVHKSPAALLGGMTAFAAVLMLIFKDSILGLVSGVQMSQNDMLRVGDWIVVPNTPANGVVLDVTLTTVKVQNFDNTIIMVPPYTLVSSSFQNWRGMSDSGVRRISQAVYINPDSVAAPEPGQIETLVEKYPILKPFVSNLQQANKTIAWDKGVAPVNGTLETNLGLYRAYMTSYLVQNEMIDHTKDLMLYSGPMSPEGIPVNIYCFSVTTQWQAFEAVLSAVMEHAVLAASWFGLEVLSADHLEVDMNAAAPAKINKN